jgi:hypothetical protein
VLWLGLFLVILSLAAWIWGEFVQREAGTKDGRCDLFAAAWNRIRRHLEKQLQWRESAAKKKESSGNHGVRQPSSRRGAKGIRCWSISPLTPV